MFLPLGFFLSVALHSVFTTAEPGCDGFGWTHFNGACYKAFAYFFTRSQADTVCQKVGGEAAMWGIFHGTTNLDISEEKYVLSMWQPPAVAAGAEFGLICRKRAVEKPSVSVCPVPAAAPAKPVPAEPPAVQRGRGGLANSAASDSASSNSKRQSSSTSDSKQFGSASQNSDQNNLVINFYGDERGGGKRGSLRKGHREEESEVDVNSRKKSSRDEAAGESEFRQSKRFGRQENDHEESEARSSSDYDVVSEDASSDQSASSIVNEASASSASRFRASKKEEASSFAAKSSKRSFSSSASSLSS